MLADGSGHGNTNIGVYIDFADSHGSSLTQHILRNTNSVGHLTAVLVDHLDVVLVNGGRTVQYDGEAGQTALHLFQNVKTQLRLLAGLKLVGAVAGADGDGQGVHTGAVYEILNLFRAGVALVTGLYLYIIFHAGQGAKLALNHYTVGVGILNHLFGQSNVLLIGLAGAVDHHGGEAAVNAGLAGLKIRAVIQVQGDGQTGLFGGSLYHSNQVVVRGVLACAGGALQDHRGVQLLGCTGDALHDLHVIYIESTDGVTALISLLEHFGSCYQWHSVLSIQSKL